jgi:hypothetical protein
MRDLTDEGVTVRTYRRRWKRIAEICSPTLPRPIGRPLDGRSAMSTNTSILHPGSVNGARAGLAALGTAILLAAAAIVLNTGPATSGVDQAPFTDAQVQKALIDVRTGERASAVDPAPITDVQVQKALIDVRAGERSSGGAAVPTAEFWAEFRAAEREMR